MFNKHLGTVFVFLAAAAGLAIGGGGDVGGQNSQTFAAENLPALIQEKAPVYLYKSINIGMVSDEVRKKLGDPKDKSDSQDLFVFNEEESAQFIYSADHKVTAIVITFSGKMKGAPTAKDVFGEEVPAKPDGGVFKMVRYPKAGYWISYNKIVGDDSVVSIAMQKI